MDDTFFMGSLHAFSNLAANFEGFFDRHRTSGNTLSQGFSWDQFQGKKTYSIRLFQPIDGCNVGVVQ